MKGAWYLAGLLFALTAGIAVHFQSYGIAMFYGLWSIGAWISGHGHYQREKP